MSPRCTAEPRRIKIENRDAATKEGPTLPPLNQIVTRPEIQSCHTDKNRGVFTALQKLRQNLM